MDYLFLGLLYDKEKEELYLKESRCGLQNAVNIFQWNIIDGLIENDIDLTVAHVLPVGAFPKSYKRPYLSNSTWNYKTAQCFEIGGSNLPIIKQIDRKRRICNFVEKWINERKTNEKAIIVYSLYLPFLQVLDRIKKKYPEVNVTLIVPDLPSQYGILPKNPIKAIVYKSYGEKMMKYVSVADKYVLLTKHMADIININKDSYIVVEGTYSNCSEKSIVLSKQDKTIFFYSGTLFQEFGITDLLESFSKIDNPDIELWICGSGNAEKDVREYEKKDGRIRFYGFCKSSEVAELRKQASFLVNPRQNKGEYTKYSFPSKTMEYLASGIPTIMYKLSGVPDEYDPYIIYVKGDGSETLKNTLESAILMPQEERKKLGEQAMVFIKDNKNTTVQAKRILELINNNR